MEENAGAVEARAFPSRSKDWFDGGVSFTEAYAVRLRAALEGHPLDEDIDTQYHPEVEAVRAFLAPLKKETKAEKKKKHPDGWRS